MYYVVSREYIGPDQEKRLNSEAYEITTEEPTTNMSHEVRTDGWLGCTNDWDAHAHGEFETVEAARSAIAELIGDNRRETSDDDNEIRFNESIVESWTVGKYEEWGADTSINWCYDGRADAVDADTTDEQITATVAQWNEEAHQEISAKLHTQAVEEWLKEYRDELKEAAQDA